MVCVNMKTSFNIGLFITYCIVWVMIGIFDMMNSRKEK